MTRRTAVLAAATLLVSAAPAAAQTEQVIPVPGFADFLAVDGDTVWATNTGRVERWSRTGKLAEVPVARPCGAMAIAANSLWVANCKEGVLTRIDLATAKVVATVPTGIANAKEGEMIVAAGDGSVWIGSDATGEIARVDPATNSVVATVKVAPGSYFLAYGSDALWAVSQKGATIQKIDPKTNTVVATTPLGRGPGFLVAGEGAVWVQEQGDGTVAKIDSATGKVAGRVKVDETLKYGDIDAGGGLVWLRTTDGQTFVAIDPATLTIKARVGKPAGSGALRYTPAGLWTSAHDAHTLSWWPDPAKIVP
jgi:DNA-binding beta-propeller fold protein YncE